MGFYFDGSGQRARKHDIQDSEHQDEAQFRPVPGKSSRTHGGGNILGIPGKMSLTTRLAMRVDRFARDGGRAGIAPNVRELVDSALHSTGQALPENIRRPLEKTAGTPLDDVRIHTGSTSARAAEALGAEAFAVGRDIHFAAGTYQPESERGRRLIAHEVAHTMQHDALPSHDPATIPISEPGDTHERQADEFAGLFRDTEQYAVNQEGYLPDATRTRMERTFGHSFADVRVHPESSKATGSTQAVTEGRDIHFAKDRYEPGTEHGDRLLSHELAHVIQQSQSAKVSPPTGQPELAHDDTIARTRISALEIEADRAASSAMTGRRPSVQMSAAYGTPQAFSDAEPHDQQDESLVAAQSGPQNDDISANGQGQGPDPARANLSQVEGNDSLEEVAQAERADHQILDDAERQPHEEGDAQATVERSQQQDGAAQPAVAEAATDLPQAGGLGGAAGGGAGPATVDTASPEAIIDSLARAPASQAMSAYTQAQAAAPGALQTQRDEAQQALPKIPTPTGLPAKAQTAGERASTGTPDVQSAARGADENLESVPSDRPNDAADKELVAEAPPVPAPTPTVLAGRESKATEDGKATPDPELAHSAQGALHSVSPPAIPVPTKANGVPAVDMSGEANPGQLASALSSSSQETRQAASEAKQAAVQDFGESAIFPDVDHEVLEATQELTQAKVSQAPESDGGPLALPAEALASVDAQATPILAERIGSEQQVYAQGKSQYDADSQAAHATTRQDIANLEEQSAASQTAAQTQAQTQVASARTDWQTEIDAVETDFQSKAQAARGEHQDRISAKQEQGNRDAAGHIADAENKAEAKKAEAETQVQSKKDGAKSESKGFWGWVKSKAKALVDGLKAAVNFIYDNLRKAVKALFEAAKQLALAAIEVARMAIVGLLKAYGALLKGFVQIALAAFPKLRDAITRRIDAAVDKATEIVNQVADTLKKGVTAIIDFLASTIDKILGLIQDLYNGILTVIGMLVSGELAELLEKLGNLVDAAKTAPGQFETAAYEELLGGNLDEPLSPAELMAAGRTPPSGAGDPEAGGFEAGEDGEMPGPPWSEANVGVDSMIDDEMLSPELSEQLMEMTGGEGEAIFGESDDASRDMDAILGRDSQSQSQAPGQAAAYDDGLSSGERAAVKWQVMKQGLAEWWSKNWPYVLAGGVLGVAGFIVANILTGGAILAALPAIMTAVGYIFTGAMVVQLAGHLRDFLQKGWNGDVQGGGKSLAKGLAAGAIELITLLTFKVGSVAMKGAKAAAKGAVKAGQAVAKGVAKLARRGLDYVIKGGKVLLRGVGRGISKGVKRVRDFGARLLGKTKFKGFRIRIKGRRFILEGKINPWVKIAEGEIKVSSKRKKGYQFLDDDELDALRKGGVPDDPKALKEFDTRVYKETTASGAGKVGDGLTGDHIPSRAALIENFKLKNPGKPVPESVLNNEGVTVVLKGTDHASLSRTYAGRNSAAQIAIDAGDLGAAFRRDADAIMKGLHGDKRLTMEIVGAYQTAYVKNVAKGVFNASGDIDGMFMQFMELVKKSS